MQERWIILTTYTDIRLANADADLLKLSGIPCHVTWNDPDKALFLFNDEVEDWVSLEVREEDYETAADFLELEAHTVETISFDPTPPSQLSKRKRNLLWLSGLFTAIVLLRVLSEFV